MSPQNFTVARRRALCHTTGVLAVTVAVCCLPWLIFGTGAVEHCNENVARMVDVDESNGEMASSAGTEDWHFGTQWIVAFNTLCCMVLASLVAASQYRWWLTSPYIYSVRCYLTMNWFVVTSYTVMAQWSWCGGAVHKDAERTAGVLWRLVFLIQLLCICWNMTLVRRRLVKLENSFGKTLNSSWLRWPLRGQLVIVFAGLLLTVMLALHRLLSSHLGKEAAIVYRWSAVLIEVGLGVSATLHIIVFFLVTWGFFVALRFTMRQAELCVSKTPAKLEQAEQAVKVARLHVIEVPIGMLPMVPAMAAQYLVWLLPALTFPLFAVLNVTNLIGCLCCARRVFLLSGIGGPLSKEAQDVGRGLSMCSFAPHDVGRGLSAMLEWTSGDDRWDAKVSELAHRGLTLKALLRFYQRLGTPDCMPHFDPAVHKTSDVVRWAIIPETANSPYESKALATQLMQGKRVLPRKMVSHSWSNNFSHLVACVVADALGLPEYECVVSRLQKSEIKVLMSELFCRGRLEDTFWICAFSVDQHVSICDKVGPADIDSVTGCPLPVCDCCTLKQTSSTEPVREDGQSIGCEMNKFDDMMTYMATVQCGFSQVIAVDYDFNLFRRAWVMAELQQARALGLPQFMHLHSRESLECKIGELETLRVEDMAASNPADKDMILAKIPDKAAFDADCQKLIFAEDGLLQNWSDGFAMLEVVGAVARQGWQSQKQLPVSEDSDVSECTSNAV